MAGAGCQRIASRPPPTGLRTTPVDGRGRETRRLSLVSDSKTLVRGHGAESAESPDFSGYFTQNRQETPVIA